MRFERLPCGLLSPRGPEIHVPKYADIEVSAPPMGFAGYIGWELKRGGRTIRDSGGLHHNLFVNQGMNTLAVAPLITVIAKANCGTGSTVPAITDVNLVAEVGTAKQNSSPVAAPAYVAGPPDYWYRRWTYTFTEAFANGNLTEFGIFDTNPVMSIRQLLKDNTGTPTTIVKTNVDQLVVTFEMRIYIPVSDVAGTVSISAVSYDTLTRGANVNNAFGPAQVLTGGLTDFGLPMVYETDVLVARTSNNGAGTNMTDGTQTAYVGDSFYLENKCICEPASANFGTGIGSVLHYYSAGQNTQTGMFQTSFTPKIPKTNTKKLTMYFRRNWTRYP